MKNYKLYENEELLDELPKERIKELFYNFKKGSNSARNEILIHNMKLVIFEVNRKFKNISANFEDLVAVGNIGLITAVDTYDVSKNIEFSTYAIKCIDNEIYAYIRQINKSYNDLSFETEISGHRDDNFTFESIIGNSDSLTENYEKLEIYKTLRKLIIELPNLERQMIMLKYGFYNDKEYLNKELMDMFNLSKGRVSRLINKTLDLLGSELENLGLIELPKYNHGKENNSITLLPFYDYFKGYDKEDIMEAIKKLLPEEQFFLSSIYKNNLLIPVDMVSKNDRDKIINKLIPKISMMVRNKNLFNIKYRKKSNPNVVEQYSVIKINKYTEEVLYLIKKFKYVDLKKILSSNDALIMGLRFGLVDGKYLSIESIALLLNIPKTQVIESLKTSLTYFVENKKKIESMFEAKHIKLNRGK